MRREWATEVGPVDLMCRDGSGEWVAVEIKRIATIEAVEQLTRYLGFIREDPRRARAADPRGAEAEAAGGRRSPSRAASAASRSTSRCSAASASRT